jgi:hypothetical protein
VNGAIPAGSSWSESFDFSSGSGLAAFLIDPGAHLGDQDAGTIRVLYDRFSADPSSCGSCLVDSGSVDAVASVTAAADAPEPWSGCLLLLGIAAMGVYRRARWHRRPDHEAGRASAGARALTRSSTF